MQNHIILLLTNYTGGNELIEESEKTGGLGTLAVAGHLKSYVKKFKDEHFPVGTQDQEIHLFAIAVGITQGERLEQDKWQKGSSGSKSHPGVHIQNLPDLNALIAILEALGDIEPGINPKSVLNEYLNGGLTYLKRQKTEKVSLEDIFEIIPQLGEYADS